MSVPRICCVGELMWDFHGESGSTLETAAVFSRVPGGAAANVAMGLVETGVSAAVAGVVADDAFGEGMRQALAARGLDVSAVRAAKGRTGLVFIEEGGRGRYLSYRPGFSSTARLSLPRSWRRIPDGALLHVAALDPDWVDPATYSKLAQRVKKRHGRVTLDVNARPRAWRARRGIPAAMRALLRMADVVKASTEDIAMLGVDDAGAEARRRLKIGGTLVITAGPEPTTAFGPWGEVSVVPPKVRPKRTVGAGDAFCAGMLGQLTFEEDLDAADVWTRCIAAGQLSASRWVRG